VSGLPCSVCCGLFSNWRQRFLSQHINFNTPSAVTTRNSTAHTTNMVEGTKNAYGVYVNKKALHFTDFIRCAWYPYQPPLRVPGPHSPHRSLTRGAPQHCPPHPDYTRPTSHQPADHVDCQRTGSPSPKPSSEHVAGRRPGTTAAPEPGAR
jgi:hypothetical protein